MNSKNETLRSEAQLLDRLREALEPVRNDLVRVGEALEAHLSDPLARRVVYLVQAGGKRLRPALVLLSGLRGPAPRHDALISAAAAVELIHTATLIHDDIIDLSTLRRRQPTFHRNWGTERALLTGDFLYATAFSMLARVGDPYVTEVIAKVCEQLSLGELREVESRYRLDLTELQYTEIIYGKTASLIEGCCHVGAHLGGYDPEVIRCFAHFGREYGLAFQVADDCLDLSGEVQSMGKAVMEDLDKGTLSLPIIYLRESLPEAQFKRIFAPFVNVAEVFQDGAAGPGIDAHERRVSAQRPEFMQTVASAVQSSGSLEKAQRRAVALAESAKQAILEAEPEGYEAFASLADYAVSRRA